MRYYLIEITDADAESGATPYRRWTSQDAQGNFIPGALNVEFDIPVSPFATPAGGTFVRVWGVPLRDISQATDLQGKTIRVYGGMQKGLPLSNPKQSGLLIEGVIRQPFGNWIGVNQTLDMVISADGGLITSPKNIVLPWRKGMSLADAIRTTLGVGFPEYTMSINISPNLVLPHDEPGYYQTLTQFAQYIKQVSQNIIGGTYSGVDIILREKSFEVYDGTQVTTPKPIEFTDLIGQPTWINPGQIQTTCAMRADLAVGGYITLPPGQVTTTIQSPAQYRNSSAFQGTYQLDSIRHLGNFRQPLASAWVTVLVSHLAA